MARKKRKPLIRRIRRRMPPPAKVMRDKSKYNRKEGKQELIEETE